MTIPGMNVSTASAAISRIGDIRRFPTKKHIELHKKLNEHNKGKAY